MPSYPFDRLNPLQRERRYLPSGARGSEPLLVWLKTLLDPANEPPYNLTVLREAGSPPLAVSINRHPSIDFRAVVVGGVALGAPDEEVVRVGLHYVPWDKPTAACEDASCRVYDVNTTKATMAKHIGRRAAGVISLDPSAETHAEVRAEMGRAVRVAVSEHESIADPVLDPGALNIFTEMSRYHTFDPQVVARVQDAAAHH